MSERVLVAGGSSGVGLLVVRRLSSLGISTRCLSRRPAEPVEGVEIMQGDLLDPADCRRAVKECGAIICTVGENRVPEQRDPVDGRGIIQLIDAARTARVSRMVLVSSMGAGDSWPEVPAPVRWLFQSTGTVPLLEAKTRSEEHLRKSGLIWTILRPGYLTNHRMRAEPFCQEGVVPGLTTRQAVADVAVRTLGSDGTAGRTLAVCNRWVSRMMWGRKTQILEAPWEGWNPDSSSPPQQLNEG